MSSQMPNPRAARQARSDRLRHSVTRCCVLATLLGCGDGSPQPARFEAEGTSPRVLRVGYAQEPPYAFADASGRVTGLGPELLRTMQSAIGVDSLRFVLIEFDRLLGELEAGRVDVIGAGLFITEERGRRVAFTQPISEVRGAVLLRAADPLVAAGNDARAAATPDDADVTPLVSVRALLGPVGVLAGAVEVDLALASGIPDARLIRYPDVSTAVPALLGGDIQALLLSEPSLRWLEARSTGRLVARLLDTMDGRALGRPAFATRHADARLARRIDSALTTICRERSCDSLLAHFGFRPTPW